MNIYAPYRLHEPCVRPPASLSVSVSNVIITAKAEVERATVAFEAKLAEDRVASEDARLRARAAEAARLTEEAALRSEERRRATELALKAKQMEQDKVMKPQSSNSAFLLLTCFIFFCYIA